MENNNMVELKNLKRKKKEKYRIIITFITDDEDDKYLVYTDDIKDSDGFIKVYAGKYKNEDNKNILVPLENEDELEIVEYLLSVIEKEKNT